MTAKTLRTVSTVDAVVDALRKRVLDGSLPPDTFIREVQVATDYGVARHTVRAATQVLAQEGLLRHSPNRGMHVPSLDAEAIVDVFRLRAALESEAVRLLIMAGGPLSGPVRAAERLDALPNGATWDQVVEADLAFHRGIIEETGSQRLARAYAAVQSEIELCMIQLRPHYEHPSEVAAEHRELLATILARNLAGADQAFRKHWDEAEDNLLSSLARTATPRTEGTATP